MAAPPSCHSSDDPLGGLNCLRTHPKVPPYFSASDFPRTTLNNYPQLCTLTNENLFPITRFWPRWTPYEVEKYASLKPALLLASRIIVTEWETYRFVIRPPRVNGYKVHASEWEVLGIIRRWIPDIDFEDADFDDDLWGVQHLEMPSKPRDVLVVDKALLRILRSTSFTHERKIAAAVYMAVLIAKGMADVLQFRSRQHGQEDESGARFLPGHVSQGDEWEDHLFGEMVPVCERYALKGMRGLAVPACTFAGGTWMKCGEDWMRSLFDENAWKRGMSLRPPREARVVRNPSLGLGLDKEDDRSNRAYVATVEMLQSLVMSKGVSQAAVQKYEEVFLADAGEDVDTEGNDEIDTNRDDYERFGFDVYATESDDSGPEFGSEPESDSGSEYTSEEDAGSGTEYSEYGFEADPYSYDDY